MPRPATGQVIEKPGARGRTFALRFRAYGKREYVTLGSDAEGWTTAKAENELANVLADVRRGIWRPPTPAPEPPAAPVDPTFHEFASEWFEAHKRVVRDGTVLDYEWQLSVHLLPFFARHRLSQITIAEVDRYRDSKVREAASRRADLEAWQKGCAKLKHGAARPPRPPQALGATSINKTITRLGQILDVAEERELIARNPCRVNPRNRKLRSRRPARPYLDRAAQIDALLVAGADLDKAADRGDGESVSRRPMLATMTLAGLRVSELCALRWRDVDLAAGRLRVADSKTDAGVRMVDLLPLLRDELIGHKARLGRVAQDAPVFATRTGKARDRHNVRERVVKPACVLASERLIEAGGAPLPELTPHALRRTFASVLIAIGRDPSTVMRQIGHTDAKVTLELYAKPVADADREALRALVDGLDCAPMGTSDVLSAH